MSTILINEILNQASTNINGFPFMLDEEKNNILKSLSELIDKPFNLLQRMLMNVSSFDINIVNHTYSLFEKADGQRSLLYINNKSLYLVDINMNIKKLQYELKNNDFNNTLLDGEYLSINGLHMYLIFDILYYKKRDIRKLSFDKRYKIIVETDNIFNSNSIYKNVKEPINHKNAKLNLTSYTDALNIEIQKSKPIIVRKLKFDVEFNNTHLSNLYKNAIIIHDNIDQYPYDTDGLVLVNNEMPYSTKSSYPSMKLKGDQTTLDFYVELEENTKYHFHGKIYVNGLLYVGISTPDGKRVKKGLFRPNGEDGYYDISIPINEYGFPVSKHGEQIKNGYVIECSYKENKELPQNLWWVADRVRYDKMNNIRQKYGNNQVIANKTFNLLGGKKSTISFDDVRILSDENKFVSHMTVLLDKPYEHTTDEKKSSITEEPNNSYWQQSSSQNLQPMRRFINLVKAQTMRELIPFFPSKLTILDSGFGQGGSIMMYHRLPLGDKKLKVVGIDPNESALIEAKRRIDNYKGNNKNLKISLAKINPSNEFDKQEDDFENIMNKIKSNNKIFMWVAYLSMHYNMDTPVHQENYLKNIIQFMGKTGYVNTMQFDGDKVHSELVKNNGVLDFKDHQSFDNTKSLFKITAEYDINNPPKIKPINVYNSLINVIGSSYTEYLITSEIIQDTFLKKRKIGKSKKESSYFEIYKQFNLLEKFDVEYLSSQEAFDIYSRQNCEIILQLNDKSDHSKEQLRWIGLFNVIIFKKISNKT